MTVSRIAQTVRSISVAVAVANSEDVGYENFSGGIIMIPVGSAITSISFHVYDEASATWHALADSVSTDITAVVTAGKAVALPSALFGAVKFRLVANAAGTVTLSLKQ